MLGHKVAGSLSRHHEVWTATREPIPRLETLGIDAERNVLIGDLSGPGAEMEVDRVMDDVDPETVINCVGLVKQVQASRDPVRAIRVNALLPHLLAAACAPRGSSVVTISTDCVFSGDSGNYTEASLPDAKDLYGRSKLLGELDAPHLTLRTSIIGRQLAGASGLVEWFLSNRGANRPVPGFSSAVFSGLPTVVLADVIGQLIEMEPGPRGLFHVSSSPIDKLSLLRLLNEAFDAGIDIQPDPSLRIDRSLDSSRFREATGIGIPDWTELVGLLVADSTETDYDRVREEMLRLSGDLR